MFGYWGFAGTFFGIFNALLWILFALFISRLFRYGHGGRHHGHHRHENDDGSQSNRSAMDYLKERYAKGEIDKAEYDRVRKDLGE